VEGVLIVILSVSSTPPASLSEKKGASKKLERDVEDDKKFHHISLSVWCFY
jgi:hypothetical protein